MSNNIDKNKYLINKYIFKSKYIENEINELNILLDKYDSQFQEDFNKELSYLNTRKSNEVMKSKINQENIEKKYQEKFDNNYNVNIDNEEKNKKSENINIDIEKKINKFKIFLKKLYKKVLLKTHPDKCKIIDNIKYYEVVDKAYKNEDILQLLIVSQQVCENDIYNLDITDEIITKLDSSISQLNNKLNSLKDSVSWQWCNLKNPEDKENLKKFLYKKWNLPNDFLERYNDLCKDFFL